MDTYQNEFLHEYKNVTLPYIASVSPRGRRTAKLKGSMTACLIKKYVESVIQEKHLDCAVSDNNVYIEGEPLECDLLILKKDAEPVLPGQCIYRKEDVKAILECKSTGIFDDDPFDKELETLKELNGTDNRIKFGYLCVSEDTSSNNRLLNLSNTKINAYVDDAQRDHGVYCFSRLSRDYSPYENPYTFAEFIAGLCRA